MALSVSSPVVRLLTGLPGRGRHRPAGRARVRRGSAWPTRCRRSTRPPEARCARATASGEIQGRLYEFFVTPVVRRRLEAGARGHRRRRQGGRLHDRAAAEGRDRRGADGARPPDRRGWRSWCAGRFRRATPCRRSPRGSILAGFSVDQYKTGERFGPRPTALTIVAPQQELPGRRRSRRRSSAARSSASPATSRADSRTSRPTC